MHAQSLLLPLPALCWIQLVQPFYITQTRLHVARQFLPQNSQRQKLQAAAPASSTSGTSDSTSDSNTRPLVLNDFWNLLVVGDLHMEDDISTHEQARTDCLQALQQASLSLMQQQSREYSSGSSKVGLSLDELIQSWQNARAGDLSLVELQFLCDNLMLGDNMLDKYNHLVSLGDLGRKDIRHEPGDAGTTESFKLAKAYFDKFMSSSNGGNDNNNGVSNNIAKVSTYNLVTGNHDLEGLDEFDTDAENLQAWMNTFGSDTPYFQQYIGENTLLLGLSTVRFRDAPYSSHEVHVNDDQVDWFVQTVQAHPASQGWKILVFSHAPIIGSGLRVLQNVHVTNGCAWLNHVSDNRNIFIDTVKANPQIKCWCSGHFHLSHDYQDAIVMVEHDTHNKSKTPADEGSTTSHCAFVQVGVMGPVSSRDGRRQTRLIQGDTNQMKIYSIQHHLRNESNAPLRLDLTVDFSTGRYEFAHGSQEADREEWFQAYTPKEEDGCYLENPDGSIGEADDLESKVCWWHMKDGRVLGLHQRQLVEYDAKTLSPLGIVVNSKQLGDRQVVVVESGTVLVLMDKDTQDIEVVHPNDDGSYWRKYQRNKRVRQEEKAREAIAKMWANKGV